MNEKLSAFLSKVAADEALQAKFEELDNFDQAYELASSIQDGFTKEEFVKAMEAIRDAAGADISDEDLAAIAGGEGEASQQAPAGVPAGYEPPTSGEAVSQGISGVLTGGVSGAVSDIGEGIGTAVSDIAQTKISEATADLTSGVYDATEKVSKASVNVAKSAAI